MTTPWDRVESTDDGQAFKTWLKNRLITEEDFNDFDFEKIDELRTNFEQQQQHGINPEHLKKLAAFAEAEMEDRTKNKPMSEASAEWAESILAAYRIRHERALEVIVDPGSLPDPPAYQWSTESNDDETWNKSEHGGTPGALAWLSKHLLGASKGKGYGAKIVSGASLPKVKENQKSATGKADIAIGTARDITYGDDPFAFVRGLVELKTDRHPLNTGQNLLQLLSLSTTSSFKKAVVLLATNCKDQWELNYFSDAITIKHEAYVHGGKAWEGFMKLMNSAREREYPDTPVWIAALPEIPEQDLDGFKMSGRDTKKAKAMQDEAMLEHFADRLADVYGERPSIPSWARANAKIPNYYA